MDNFKPIGLSHFFGGMSTDIELGGDAQFYYGSNVDFRKKPSSLTLLPKPTKTSGSVVVDLVQAIDQLDSGVRYALGDTGTLYKVDSGTWSVVSTLGENGGAGLLYRPDVDMLYATGQTKIARIPRTSTPGTFDADWFASGVSSCTTCTKTGGAATYTVTASITESATHMRTFTTDIEPLYKIGVYVVAKGTGNWTLTLHDDANTVLGTVTIANASLTNGALNYFVFSSPIRVQRGINGAGSALTYHYHVTSTVADGTLQTTTASSIADCNMELWATALVPTNNGIHPMIQFSNFTLIGNGRYVAAYEPLQNNPTTADFDRHRITLPPGYEVCGFAQKNLMCVIGAEKRSSSGEFQDGMLFFWDGVADTYNDFWPVPEGSPEAMFSHKNVVYFIAGNALYRMRGGDEPVKIRTFRGSDSEYSGISDITHCYPNMMTVRRGILLIGYPGVTTNQTIEHGVYSFGAITGEYPDSFGYSYQTSNGSNLETGTNNLKIGLVKSYGDTLYISWKDGTDYGVDIVDNSSAPAATGTLETLLFDNGEPFKYKNCGYIICTFDTLPADTSITIKYKIDGGSWTYSETATTGSHIVMPVDKRFYTLEFGVDIACTGTTSPEISGLHAFVDTLPKERPLGG